MKHKLLFTFTLATALLPSALRADDADNWTFDVVPYLWAASLEAKTSLPSLPPSTLSSADRFDTRISAGAMLAAQVHYRSLGLFVDFAWLRLDTEAINPGPAFSAVDLKSDFIHVTTALTYRLPLTGKFQAELLAGARLWNADEDLTFHSGELSGFTSSGSKTWVDPVIGADLCYDLSKHWFVPVRGMVGGFGVSTDLAWEVFGGLGYRFTDWCSATVGYRYLHEDYNQDGFVSKLDAHGVLIGVGFHF